MVFADAEFPLWVGIFLVALVVGAALFGLFVFFRGPTGALGLTPREIEVLRQLAHGHSNREIGEALFISPRTVNFHVTNLLAKLELDSRAGAAAFAVRHGLA